PGCRLQCDSGFRVHRTPDANHRRREITGSGHSALAGGPHASRSGCCPAVGAWQAIGARAHVLQRRGGRRPLSRAEPADRSSLKSNCLAWAEMLDPRGRRWHLVGGSMRRAGDRAGKVVFKCAMLLVIPTAALSQETGASANSADGQAELPQPIRAVFDYLTVAGTETAPEFKPLSQSERNAIFFKSLINPVLYFRPGLSAALDLKNDKPPEWEQGASGYGKRFGNITGQYMIQRTITFGVSSLLGEDNRYSGSGQKSVWRRTGYAVSSSLLARHSDGSR